MEKNFSRVKGRYEGAIFVVIHLSTQKKRSGIYFPERLEN